MRRRDVAAAVAVITAQIVALLVVGSALRWSQAIVAALVAISLVPHLGSRRVLTRPSPLFVVLGIAALLTALQLIPLPRLTLAWLTPTGATLREDGAMLLGTSPWRSLSLDAPGTLRALTFFVTLLGVAVVALRLAMSERGRYAILASVAGLAGITAIIIGLHELLGARQLYGIYAPEYATPSVLGPLLNENHLGGWMALGAVISAGLVLYRRQRSWRRAVWFVTAGICAAATVATLSRGATLALVAGILVVVAVFAAQRFTTTDKQTGRRSTLLMRSLPMGVVAACTIVLVVYSSAGGISRELARTSLQEISQPKSKYAAWRSAAMLLEEAPWVGTGRGAFEVAFTRVHPASAFATFSHVENEYVQAAVDWGLPGALALGIALGWLVLVAARRWRDGPLAATALGGLTVVLLQSNVDFGVQLLGVAIPVTLIAATLTYVPMREASARRLTAGRLLRVAHIAALLVAMCVLLSSITRSAAEDRAILDEKNLTLDALRRGAERHPLDYYNYAVTAQMLAQRGDPRAVRLLNHALLLHPTHSGLHRMAARLLYRTGRISQATIEYAAAMRGATSPRPLIAEVVALFPSEHAAAAIPTDMRTPGEIVKVLGALHRTDVATLWLTRVLDERANDYQVCEMLHELSIRHADLKIVDLVGQRCTHFQPSRQSLVVLARVLYQKGAYSQVLTLLNDVETWPGRIDDNVKAWLLLCDSHTALGDWGKAKRCVRRLDVSGYLTGDTRPQITLRLEQIDREIKKALRAEPATAVPLTGTLKDP